MIAGADAPGPISADNRLVKTARRLARSRRERVEQDRFVIEGPGLITDSVAAGLDLEAILVCEGASPPADVTPIATFVVPERAFRSIATTTTPQDALAIARRPRRTVAVGQRLVLALADVADPGNVGTLMRAAEAAGTGGVLLVGSTADPFGPKAVRSSAGSVFRVPVDMVDVDTFRARAEDGAVTVWGAKAEGGSAPDEVDLTGAPIVVVGNESHGVDAAVGVDEWLSIPMAGEPDSLNVAMAGTVLLFEAARQRRNGRNAGPAIT